jgi:hypothetical protein
MLRYLCVVILDQLDVKSELNLIEFELPSAKFGDKVKELVELARLARRYVTVYSPAERKDEAGNAARLLATGSCARTDPVNLLNALWDSVVAGREYVNEWALYLSLSRSLSGYPHQLLPKSHSSGPIYAAFDNYPIG